MKRIAEKLALAVLAFTIISCSKKENQLVDHIEAADSIMRDNMDTPKDGVEELIAYFEKNGPVALGLTLEMGIEIANIEGDGDREKRVKEIKEALETPWKNFEGTAMKFGDKVQSDKEARQLIDEYGKRWEQVGEVMEMVGRSRIGF